MPDWVGQVIVAAIVGGIVLSEVLGSTTTRHVIEVRCDGPYDASYNCTKVDRAGADLELIINPSAQKVQVSVTRNDGTWFVPIAMIMHCDVIDSDNWQCTSETTERIKSEFAMWHGRYFYSLTGGLPPDYYKAGISGLAYWAYHFGIFDLSTALAWYNHDF